MPPINEIEAVILERERAREVKVKNLLALWRDPELAEIVALLENGPIQGSQQRLEPQKLPEGIKQAIMAMAHSDQVPKRFSPRQVLGALERNGFEIKARDPIGSVRDALCVLKHDAKVRLVEKAHGENPNKFEWGLG